jgi:nifR3 family TIM-barrel protein
MNPFEKLNLPKKPVILAPLAGVSDHPFRRVCQRFGADLTYVEMLSSTALIYRSERTFSMLSRHDDEPVVGVQLTSKTADECGQAVAILNDQPFETIDLNMGCPVTKVVKNGGGSGILKDPQRVYDTIKAAKENTDKPVSAKIRLGWDKQTVTCMDVAKAAEEAGAEWLTLHGRLRNDDYSVPVNLEMMQQVRRSISIPFIGNGNLFCRADADLMYEATGADGLMVSRGALGNPMVFREIKTGQSRVGLDEWLDAVIDHLDWQGEAYGASGFGAVCMRKHLLWYLKGWPGVKRIRESVTNAETIAMAKLVILEFADRLAQQNITHRLPLTFEQSEGKGGRFLWDPKFDMDRKLDRGVGDDQGQNGVTP